MTKGSVNRKRKERDSNFEQEATNTIVDLVWQVVSDVSWHHVKESQKVKKAIKTLLAELARRKK